MPKAAPRKVRGMLPSFAVNDDGYFDKPLSKLEDENWGKNRKGVKESLEA